MNAAQSKLEKALPAALEKIQQTPGVYAVLWCGSAARGEGNEYSDLDFHALVSGDNYWRSSFGVEGVQVEVFHNPPDKVRDRFAAGDSASVGMFAEGRAVLSHPDLSALMAEAQALLNAGRPPQPVSDFKRFMLLETVMDARAALWRGPGLSAARPRPRCPRRSGSSCGSTRSSAWWSRARWGRGRAVRG